MISEQKFRELHKRAVAGERDWSKLISSDDYSAELMWLFYASVVLPADVGTVQRKETRKAFLSGYIEGFKGVTEFAAGLPEHQACEFLSNLQAELNKHLSQLLASEVRKK